MCGVCGILGRDRKYPRRGASGEMFTIHLKAYFAGRVYFISLGLRAINDKKRCIISETFPRVEDLSSSGPLYDTLYIPNRYYGYFSRYCAYSDKQLPETSYVQLLHCSSLVLKGSRWPDHPRNNGNYIQICSLY